MARLHSMVSAPTAARAGLGLLVGSLLIPLGTTTLRGMHHLVTCVDEVDQTFSVTAIDELSAIITGSTSIMRRPPEGECSAVEMSMQVRPDGAGFVEIVMPVVNRTSRRWQASVILKLDDVTTAVRVGQLAPNETRTKRLRVRLARDLQSITGTLVVGP